MESDQSNKDCARRHLDDFQEQILSTNNVAKSKSKERRDKHDSSLLTSKKTDIIIEVLKPIRVKVGGAKENFANAWNQSER